MRWHDQLVDRRPARLQRRRQERHSLARHRRRRRHVADERHARSCRAAASARSRLNWSVAGTGDFNGDGKADILWIDNQRQRRHLVHERHTDPAGRRVVGQLPPNWIIVGSDMKGDIFLRNISSGDVGMWVMNGSHIAQSVDFGSVPLNWTVAGIGDFDGNGSIDLLWRDTAGDAAIWLMNGTSIAVDHGTRKSADILEHCRNRRLQRRRQERRSLGGQHRQCGHLVHEWTQSSISARASAPSERTGAVPVARRRLTDARPAPLDCAGSVCTRVIPMMRRPEISIRTRKRACTKERRADRIIVCPMRSNAAARLARITASDARCYGSRRIGSLVIAPSFRQNDHVASAFDALAAATSRARSPTRPCSRPVHRCSFLYRAACETCRSLTI